MPWAIEPSAANFLKKHEQLLLEREADNNLILQAIGHSVQNPAPENIGFSDGSGNVAFLYNGSLLFNISETDPSPELSELIIQKFGAEDELPVKKAIGPERSALFFTREWLKKNKELRVQKQFSMVLHRLHVVLPNQPSPGQMRRAWIEDQKQLTEWYKAFWQEVEVGQDSKSSEEQIIFQMISNRQLFVWGTPRAVAMAGVGGSTPKGIRVHSVYTPHPNRSRGYARSLVAALSQLQLEQGKEFVVLYTDSLRPQNAALYESIGYSPISNHLNFVFTE